MRVLKYVFNFIFFGLLILSSLEAQEKCDSLINVGIKARQQQDFGHSLRALTQAQELALQNNWHRQQFLALLNLGATYYVMYDYDQALDYYLRAYNLSLKFLGQTEEMTVLNNIAIIYSEDKQYDKAEEFFNRAYSIAARLEENEKQGIYATNLGIVFNNKKEYADAYTYLNEARRLIKKDTFALIQSKMALAENLVLQENPLRAEKILDSISSQIKSYNREINSQFNYLKASIHKASNEIPQAIDYGIKALNDSEAWERKIEITQLLSTLYQQNDNLSAALRMKDSIIQYSDSLHYRKNLKVYQANKLRFEIQNYQKELEAAETQLSFQKKIKNMVLGAVVIILLISGWAIRNLMVKYRQKKLIHQKNQEIVELQLQQEKRAVQQLTHQIKTQEQESAFESKKILEEMEVKNRKLASKALSLASRNEVLKDLIAYLSRHPALVKNITVKSKIKELTKYLNSESEWEDYTRHFEEVNQGILKKLKARHPKLKPADLRFISYLYMNLSPKEIASILNITIDATWKRKERIAKKMNLQTANDLICYISGF